MTNSDWTTPERLFIVVRRDLSCEQRAVQACHALAELMLHRGDDP